jgi:hypothetical protein
MTDPKDTVSTQTLAADELPDELLTEVAGGADSSIVRPPQELGGDSCLIKPVATFLEGDCMWRY